MRRVDSSIVRGAPDEDAEEEVVKAQREALAAREERRGSAVPGVKEEMPVSEEEEGVEEAGRLSERGTDVIDGFVQVSWW